MDDLLNKDKTMDNVQKHNIYKMYHRHKPLDQTKVTDYKILKVSTKTELHLK
jgi:hypothetical protein